jgi:outer membrane lipoprotein-sorting protein
LPKFAAAISLASFLCAQQPPPQPTPDYGGNKAPRQINLGAQPAPSRDLQAVLTAMDTGAEKLKTAQASVVSQQYSKVVDETDTQQGTIYFRRRGKDLEMALNITQPDAKYVLVSNGKAQLYQPSIDQVTEYSVGNNREEVEGMFALGFGGRGHDLLKSFDVRLLGTEPMDGVSTSKLELIPKSAKVHNMFSKITLWVDPARDVSIQQQFDEPSGDWRKAHYTNIKLNDRISNDVFKLNTTGKTKVVRPQGS